MHLFIANSSWTYIHESVFEKYRPSYTLKNLKKQNMIRLGNHWRAKKMPDFIKCYEPSVDMPWYVKVPSGLRSYPSIPFYEEWQFKEVEFPKSSITMHDYQEDVVSKLSQAKTWLIKSGAWSWKTIIIIEWIRALKRKTLIVMKDLTLMKQMVRDVQNFLWITPLQISWKNLSKKALSECDSRITIVSIESRDKIPAEELASYGTIFFDEAHTYFSDDRREWLGSLSPQYLFWLTATPNVNHMENKIFPIYFWNQIETKWIKIHVPHYYHVYSDFEFYLDDPKDFSVMKEAMYTGEKRNKLIVDTVVKNIDGRKWLVFCEYVSHAKVIKEILEVKWIKTYLMVGEVPDIERERIQKEVTDYQWTCVIVWSHQIIGTWFNIPELSFAILTIPIRFDTSVEQFVGRLSRVHPTKPQAKFYEITDHLVPMLARQSQSRARVYRSTYPTWKVSVAF